MNEITKLKPKISKCVKKEYHSVTIDFARIVMKMLASTEDDKPDMIIEDKDVVYIIEHFAISFYENTKVGDTYRHFQASKDYRFSRYNNSMQYYLNNFGKIYKHHANKIDSYVEKAKQKYPGKVYKMIFLVEDTSDAIVVNAKNGEELSVFNYLVNLSLILQNSKLDGVINYVHSSREDFIEAYDRAKLFEDCCELKKSIVKVLKRKTGYNLSTDMEETSVNFSDTLALEDIITIKKTGT